MCVHNARTRFTHGFHCNDCNTWFAIDSPTYRSGELLSSLWMVLHNINADRLQNDLETFVEVERMCDKIGIGEQHDNYEDIISEAETLMLKYGKNSRSAEMVLGG